MRLSITPVPEDSLPGVVVFPWQDHPEGGAFSRTGFQFDAGVEEFAEAFDD
jgi:hypothetical protein